ncbi:HNH endonuclease [Klebsiella aerogenes]
MKRVRALPKLSRLKELLDYNPDTGVFLWKVKRAGTAKAGTVAGTPHKNGYYCITIDGKLYLLSRIAYFMATGKQPFEVDHINGVRNDNRALNLRPANRSENCFNKSVRSDSLTGIKGITWIKDLKKWQARCTGRDRKRIHLGYFEDLSTAISTLNKFRLENHGDFAKN